MINHCSIIITIVYIIRVLPIIISSSSSDGSSRHRSSSSSSSITNVLIQIIVSKIIWLLFSFIFDITTSNDDSSISSSGSVIGFNELMIMCITLPAISSSNSSIKQLVLSVVYKWSLVLTLLSSLVYLLDWNEEWMIWPIPTLILLFIGTIIDQVISIM